jgi:hypothetical protein
MTHRPNTESAGTYVVDTHIQLATPLKSSNLISPITYVSKERQTYSDPSIPRI